MKCLITIIVPVYNAVGTIERCLDSVFCQLGVEYEVIVVDDGSNDGTSSILQENYQDRIRYIRQENAGPAAARNRGISESKGDFIAFLDADDEWCPGKLQMQLSRLAGSANTGFCFTDMSHWESGSEVNASYLHERGYQHVSGGRIYENLLHECFVFTPSVLVPRAVLERVGGFDEGLRIAEDYDLWLRIAERHDVVYIDRPLVRRHRNGRNLTSNLLLYAESSISMMEQILALQQGNAKYKEIICKRLSVMHNNAGYHHRKVGINSLAKTHYQKSLAYSLNVVAAKGLLAITFHDLCRKLNLKPVG